MRAWCPVHPVFKPNEIRAQARQLAAEANELILRRGNPRGQIRRSICDEVEFIGLAQETPR
jgi:hypothetical protein